jgi:hypothetical protein
MICTVMESSLQPDLVEVAHYAQLRVSGNSSFHGIEYKIEGSKSVLVSFHPSEFSRTICTL